ncbi:MAG: hypothetical protein U9O90_03680 [Euryarchaeota archaeon]|nr:hypothetical protein [Euryarchaeota archaeon]
MLDGEGSLQMSNILPIVAEKKPVNFTIVCLDNGTRGSTGDQLASYADMDLMAMGAGVENIVVVHRTEELRYALERLYDDFGPRFLHVMVKPGNVPAVPNIKLTPEQIKGRFMKAMSGKFCCI